MRRAIARARLHTRLKLHGYAIKHALHNHKTFSDVGITYVSIQVFLSYYCKNDSTRRSSHQMYSFTEAATRCVRWKKVFLKISQNSQEYTCASFLQLYKRHRFFTVDFAKFLRTPFFTEHLWMTASVNENTIFSFIIYLAQVKALNFTLKHAKASSNK